MPVYRAFSEQLSHYFDRPHERFPDELPSDPSAWFGSELAHAPEKWMIELSAAEIDEIGSAARLLIDAGIPFEDVTRDMFALPGLADKISDWRQKLNNGFGFFCLRGLPVDTWGDEMSAYAYWGLGHHLGMPGAQNPQNELLGHVVDYNEESVNPMVRRYRTSGNIDFHCDTADVVALLCLRKAKVGGQSRLASSVTIFNEIRRTRPDLAEKLFEPFKIDKRGEHRADQSPVSEIAPCAFFGGRLSTFWHSEYFRSADRHDCVPDFSDEHVELMNLYDDIAASAHVYLDMWLEPGDMQFISNHVAVHARTSYEDWAEPDKKRHLLRLWLSLPR